jgi:hypothetical protein
VVPVDALSREGLSRGQTTSSSFRYGSFAFEIVSDLDFAQEVLHRMFASFEQVPMGTAVDHVYELRQRSAAWFTVHRDGAPIQQVPHPGSMVDWLIADVTRCCIDEDVARICVHAGAVSIGDVGVLIPGEPDAGKSTLTAGLVMEGSGYLSDEVAPIDPESGWVHAFPRPIVLDPSSMELLPSLHARLPSFQDRFRRERYQVCTPDLPPGSEASSAEVRLVIVRRFDRGQPLAVRRLSEAGATYALATNVFHPDRLGDRGLQALAMLAGRAPAYVVSGASLPQAIAAVQELAGTVGP